MHNFTDRGMYTYNIMFAYVCLLRIVRYFSAAWGYWILLYLHHIIVYQGKVEAVWESKCVYIYCKSVVFKIEIDNLTKSLNKLKKKNLVLNILIVSVFSWRLSTCCRRLAINIVWFQHERIKKQFVLCASIWWLCKVHIKIH